MSDISKIDKRMNSETFHSENGFAFYDAAKKPFDLYGVMHSEERGYYRLPREVAETVSSGVLALHNNTAGGRIRFSTDSSVIAIKVELTEEIWMDHMALIGQTGFDLYKDDENGSVYVSSFRIPKIKDNTYYSEIKLSESKMCNYTINFPLYNGVRKLEVGVKEGSVLLGGLKYRDMPPIVYYGSSITQGGCASRPGNAYQAMIMRKNNIDHVNLGFSGNAKGEKEIADYMADLDMSLFFCDYDYNAPSAEHLNNTHYKLYETIRAKHPDIPFVMVSAINKFDDWRDRREIIHNTYLKALENGDKNVYYIDGQEVFDWEFGDSCTVDACHPNDLGFYRMAEVFGKVIYKILG